MTFGLFESFERLFRFDVKNTSAEVIPPYACMELDYSLESGNSALEIDESSLIVLVKKPTADNLGSPERFLINGPMAIAVGGYGSAYKLPILQALMDIATPPSPGDTVGPVADSWLLAPGGSGWKVKSLDPSEAYVDGDTATVFVESVSGGDVSGFILAEDANVTGRGYLYAKPGTINETSGDIEPAGDEVFKLWNWQSILSSPTYAKAGYAGVRSSNNWFLNGPCIGGCQADGTIAVDSIPAGEVGTAYSHTVTGTTIDETTIDVVDLPAGLTYNALTQEISGTPTTAGTTLITVTADSDNGCAITKIVEFVVTEAP